MHIPILEPQQRVLGLLLTLALPLLPLPTNPVDPAPEPSSEIGSQGLDDAGWRARVSQAIERSEYHFVARPGGGLVATNRAHGLRISAEDGVLKVRPRAGSDDDSWTVRLATRSFGREGAILELLDEVRTTADQERLELVRGSLVEWFVNDERGIEQGWTIAGRPDGDAAAALWIGIELGGELNARIAQGGGSAALVDAAGDIRLHYGGLAAWDADGQFLDAALVPGPGGFGIRVSDAGARYPITVDPTLSSTAWQWIGGQPAEEGGYSVSTAGDVNGDGWSDVVVAAPSHTTPTGSVGRVLVFHGTPSGLQTTPTWTSIGTQAGARYGHAVAAAGDVDGDGYDDLLVGEPLFSGAGGIGSGRVQLFRGGPAGLSFPDWTVEGTQAFGQLGLALTSAGDANGDGFADIAVSEPHYATGAGPFRGRVHLFTGSGSGLTTVPATTLQGDEDNARFGSAMASAGDVNADGLRDLVVGSSQHDTPGGGVDSGRAYLFLGTGSGLASTPAWTVDGTAPFGGLGDAVGAAGDTNGDGFADIMVGEPFAPTAGGGVGRAHLYLGSASTPSTSPTWTVSSSQSDGFFARSVGTAGDANGDGFADIFVSAARWNTSAGANTGAVFFYLGSFFGPATVAEDVLQGSQAGAEFGFDVSAAGDTNGDGFGDLIVGERGFDSVMGIDVGRASVFLGSARGPRQVPSALVDGDQVGAQLGLSARTAGDVNGDGFSDIIVSAPLYDTVGGINAGRALVFHGSNAGPSTTTPAWTLDGDQAFGELGAAVATAGDVNGDGYADVIVATPKFNGQAGADTGRAQVFLGSASGLATSPVWSVESSQPAAGLGSSVASAGDVNGDGLLDVVIGIRSYDSLSGPNSGRVEVFLGMPTGIQTAPVFVLNGDQAGGQLGSAVASAGDVNGDSFSDLLVGSSQFDTPAGVDAGRARLYLGSSSGPLASAAWSFLGVDAGSLLGQSLASAGDVNADGMSDVVVGASLEDGPGGLMAGAARLFLGTPTGLGVAPAWTRAGIQAGANLGRSVGAAGDVNADGYGDVILGAPGFDGFFGSNAGSAELFFGSASGLSANPAVTYEGDVPNANLGRSVGPAGDTNGDGYADLIIGVSGEMTAFGPAAGRVQVHYGNRLGAPSRRPRQLRSAGGLPIDLMGPARSTTSFVIRARPRNSAGFSSTAAGRARVSLEWELEQVGDPFDGLNLGEGPSTDTGAIGSQLNIGATVGGLQPNQAYLWRARLTTDDPLFPHGHWFSLPWNAHTEAKLRTVIVDCNNNGADDALDVGGGSSNDCNGNGLPDECELAAGTAADCNSNNIPDACDLVAQDCNTDGIPDECQADCDDDGVPDDCQIAAGAPDCNSNGLPDVCDLSPGTDCNADGVPDTCQITLDCNLNSISDACDVLFGTSDDCDGNLVPDECQVDCNANGQPDNCDLSAGTSVDCNGNASPDECDIASGISQDCNANGVPDSCDLAGNSDDCDENGIPDECQTDCNGNSVPDDCDITAGTSLDCNGNGLPDECDVAGPSEDCNGNDVPDECEPDCNGNSEPDECDISSGSSDDCNENGVPDECDVEVSSEDCNGNGIPDECEPDCNGNSEPDDCDISTGDSQDCNGNGIPDECDVAGPSEDCDGNGVPDECEPDCNGNSVADVCDVTAGTSEDCNSNGVPDECDVAAGSEDCNSNQIPDECEPDCNGNSVADACDIAAGTSEDCNANGVPDDCDIAMGQSLDANGNSVPDECEGSATPFCQVSPNTASPVGAFMGFQGSLFLSDQLLTITASPVPNSAGIFYFGTGQTQIPFGEGFRCVSGMVFRFPPAMPAIPNQAQRTLNFTTMPANVIQSGSTWNFQYWFRDVAGGPSGFNLSNGLSITFGP